ncbi:hypothetical protein EDD16DRAFT_1659363 [Pisolithus croceorrhizus]|nr:hypothetical protein EDD16DRAFT_1659363 [Pisolithus croceorrhizus]KAI6159167.1 hypothetical protein EDD17DRAFT_1839448 [Pisolithus thermaeus]
MVLKMLGAAVNTLLPPKYYVHACLAVLLIVIFHAFAQGRRTNRERDMHARVVLVTGGFTPLGLTLLQNLAERGAHIIALAPKPIDNPEIEILISLLRSSTNNEQVYAEECDLTSPASIRSFCTRFLTGKETRIDAIVFAHEYPLIGSVLASQDLVALGRRRQEASLATFLILTLLLPVLLVAPVERDIRIINVVNPFYAAAAVRYSPSQVPSATSSTFQHEGWRSLQTIILTRHLQRVLDALPSEGPPPGADGNTVHVASDKMQKSNIVAVSVCPGISRADTIAPLFDADGFRHRTIHGLMSYLLLQPLLRILTKSPTSAVQSVLHVLFLPTPFKRVAQSRNTGIRTSGSDTMREVLKGGALYRECAVVHVRMPVLENAPSSNNAGDSKDTTMIEDRELGGVHLGQVVWEAFEADLKEWEKRSVPSSEKQGTDNDEPSVDTPNN